MATFGTWPSTGGCDSRYPLVAPDDPRDARYLTVCYVCTEEAKPGQEHLRNYGGVVCYSCRAFWRRSHQKSRNPNFVCKKGGDCVITVKTRRRCQKCRYNRCMMTGMSPEAVLDEDQKKIRFRKLLLKRQRLESNNPEDGSTRDEDHSNDDDVDGDIDVEGDVDVGDVMDLSNHSEEVKQDRVQVDEFSKHNLSTQQQQQPSQSLSIDNDIHSDTLVANIDAIVTSYQKALAQTKCLKSDKLFSKLNDIQRGETGISISKWDVLFLFAKMAEVFRHFALLQRQFIILDKREQRKLLLRNTPLFVQLFMGNYLLADGGHLPHQSKFEGRLSKKVWMNNFLQNLHLQKFNDITNLFCPTADLDNYARLINRLKGLPVLTSMEQKGVITFIILFDSDEDTNKHYSDLYQSYIKSCEDCLDPSDLSKILVEMAAYCSQNISWDNHDEGTGQEVNKVSNFSLFGTKEDELWIDQQFKQINEAFRSVSAGEKMMKDFLDFTSGISPLSEDHMPMFFRIMLERMHRVLKIHPEFQALPEENQRTLMARNGPLALAMGLIQAENCSRGLEQLQIGSGELNEQIWKDDFLPMIENPGEINKMSLAKDSSIPQDKIRPYLSLAEKLSVLTNDPELYKLNLLVILTRQRDPLENPTLAQVHNRYVTLLQRRVAWMCLHNPNLGDPQEILEKKFSSLNGLPKMSMFLQASVSN